MDDDEAIVREVAERGSFIAPSDVLGDACAICGKVEGRDAPLDDPANHEPSCLWRRAMDLHSSG
jgi:hypothetical protein